MMAAFYGAVVKTIVPVSSTATAEAVKLTENVRGVKRVQSKALTF